ncbi:MAG: sugar phosphate isomerase/epimerase [Methanobrevibacter thaueri]|nr:sugar phosphate isomerase/epimerase [Methanobrevibacter thaueri]
MKIGASTLAGLENGLEETLDFIETLGIEYAELVHQFPTEYPVKDVLESYNLKYSIHSPFMDVNIASLQEKSRVNSVGQIKDSIDFACEIDGEAVVVHPGLASFLASKYFLSDVYNYANESIREIKKYGDDAGVLVTVENMPDFDAMIYKDVGDLNSFLVGLDMGMTLDVGHAHHMKYSPDEMIFDSIKHIHLHDNSGDDDSHLAFGEGNIDLKYIINTLEDKKYKGIYIIEVNDLDSVEKSYKYLKKNFKI